MRAFPKIFALGTDYIRDIFRTRVEITEKVDGSQFAFGVFGGEFFMRSKGAQIFPETPEKMFLAAVNYVASIQHRLPEGILFYCEYLKSPSHNTLKYNRIPRNHLMLFGAMLYPEERFVSDFDSLVHYAEDLGVEVVPLIYSGDVSGPEFIRGLLERESVLGGSKIEGVVVKNYTEKFLLGGQPMPLMAGKYVSEAFKEVHQGWNKEHTSKGKWQTFVDSFHTEARWVKAVQHLEERGELTNAPQDIGKLIKEVAIDIAAEEMEAIKKFLWKEFGQEVIRAATRGLPEWYKQRLLERST
jgi:hypothetical protein